MPIELVAYDPGWPARFVAIRAAIADALGDIPAATIEHVGSTSVPGLAAKPVIDVDVVVERSDLGRAIDALERIGYRHRGDLGIPDRHALAAPDDGTRRNVYVVVNGSLALRNHLAVRDALRSSGSLRTGMPPSSVGWRLGPMTSTCTSAARPGFCSTSWEMPGSRTMSWPPSGKRTVPLRAELDNVPIPAHYTAEWACAAPN